MFLHTCVERDVCKYIFVECATAVIFPSAYAYILWREEKSKRKNVSFLKSLGKSHSYGSAKYAATHKWREKDAHLHAEKALETFFLMLWNYSLRFMRKFITFTVNKKALARESRASRVLVKIALNIAWNINLSPFNLLHFHIHMLITAVWYLSQWRKLCVSESNVVKTLTTTISVIFIHCENSLRSWTTMYDCESLQNHDLENLSRLRVSSQFKMFKTW